MPPRAKNLDLKSKLKIKFKSSKNISLPKGEKPKNIENGSVAEKKMPKASENGSVAEEKKRKTIVNGSVAKKKELKKSKVSVATAKKPNTKEAVTVVSVNQRPTRSMKVKLNKGLPMPMYSDGQGKKPDLYKIYQKLNEQYFEGRCSSFELKWMYHECDDFARTLGRNRVVKVNWPLHSRLPKKDLEETLLYEMVHILLFLEYQDKGKEQEKYKQRFLQEIKRINKRGAHYIDTKDRMMNDKIIDNPARLSK